MTANELFEKGEKLYHSKGKEYEAIEAFKLLLEKYPDHIKGLTYLSTMQSEICDFDGAIKSINLAEQKEQDNYDIKEQKLLLFKKIAKFTFSDKYYLDETTKECHEILSYPDYNLLLSDLNKLLYSLLDYYKLNERKKSQYLWNLAHNERKLGNQKTAIKLLKENIESIPSKYNIDRRKRELANLQREIASNYIELKQFELGLDFLNQAFENGLDDFKRTIIADVYKQMGNESKYEDTLQDLLGRINKKLEMKPEPAYIFQKFEIYKKLRKEIEIKELISDFDLITNKSDYLSDSKKKLETEINNYLQHLASNVGLLAYPTDWRVC